MAKWNGMVYLVMALFFYCKTGYFMDQTKLELKFASNVEVYSALESPFRLLIRIRLLLLPIGFANLSL